MQEPEPRAAIPPTASRWSAAGRWCRPTLSYWAQTEVHVYAFSIAANALLSFFPFLIVILSLCRRVLGWQGALAAVGLVLDDYFPGETGDRTSMVGFISYNLRVVVRDRPGLQLLSIFLLLFAANGIFEPLEVALNRAWGIARNRSYLKNQVVSLGLILLCGSLALVSTALTGWNARVVQSNWELSRLAEAILFKVAAVPVSILMLFLIYWLLPNRKVPWREVLPAAILVGLALEVLKYFNLLAWPLWQKKLQGEYGPFYRSVTIVLWSFLGAMVILAGAEWSARRARRREAAAIACPAE